MMDRLTINKDISEMNMLELAHNSCYAKDGNARYRDYDIDIDARQLSRKLLKEYANGDDAFASDEDFDEYMIDCLQYGTENIEGIIALFYRNMWAMADLRERLKEYEDLNEQGLLLRLPCKVGDKAWYLHRGIIDEVIVDSFVININLFVNVSLYLGSERFGLTLTPYKTLFFTKEEALAKLKEMEISDD